MAGTFLRNDAVSYGSDSSGLICGYVFARDQGAIPVDSAAAREWLEASREPDGAKPVGQQFIWLHFSLSNVNSERWLGDHLDLPKHYFDTLHEGPGSTRIEQADDCLIAVINDVLYDFSYEAPQIATLWMCVSRRYVVSARLHSLRSIDRLRVSVRTGEQFESAVSLLTHLLRDQADVLQQIARNAVTHVDQIEDILLAGQAAAKRSSLGSLRRVFVRLRRLLAPEPGALFRLLHSPPSWFTDEDTQGLRTASEEFSSVLNDLGALQERTKLLQEEISAHTSEQTNRSVYLLTVVTVLALPINIIAGLLGMNVGGIPLAQEEHGFWIIAALIASFTGIAGWFALSKKRD